MSIQQTSDAIADAWLQAPLSRGQIVGLPDLLRRLQTTADDYSAPLLDVCCALDEAAAICGLPLPPKALRLQESIRLFLDEWSCRPGSRRHFES